MVMKELVWLLLQAAHELAVAAEPTADKLSKSVIGAAEQVSDQAKTNADKAEKVLKDNAKQLASDAPGTADKVRTGKSMEHWVLASQFRCSCRGSCGASSDLSTFVQQQV